VALVLCSALVAPPSAIAAQRVVPPPSRGALTPGTFAITNVNLVPMTSETVVRDGAVLVRDGRIVAAGPAGRVAIPPGTRRVDGRGGFLIPGLADMHTHLYSDDDRVPDSAGPAELGVILANGITVARLMIGTPEHLVLRQDIEAGRIAGPQLWVASPQFTGEPADNARVMTTPEQAAPAVREVAAAGYDFIKLTLKITPAVYDAITAEAKRAGIRVVGHVEPEVGIPRALAAGQQIEHLDAYFEGALADHAPMRISLTQGGVFQAKNWESMDWIDEQKLTELAQATARAGVWSDPTLVVFNKAFSLGQTDEEIRGRPDWNLIPPHVRSLYMNARTRYWRADVTPERRRRYAEVRNSLVRQIVQAGGKVMAGSDSPEWLMAYGFALHRELEAFVQAGLTPFQALTAATRNPAEFLGATAEWGTIEPGKRADFVLLAANPFADIRNTRRIESVVIGGRWLDKAELQQMIDAGSRAINGAAPPGSDQPAARLTQKAKPTPA
jgi:imidazolonepropionase-like amidohydrolase